MVFPGAEVADVARATATGSPGLIGFHDRIIEADGEEGQFVLLMFFLRRRFNLFLYPRAADRVLRYPLAAVVDNVGGGQGLWIAAGPAFEKPVQLAFHQMERLFAAQHQCFHPVPTQVESVGVAEYMAEFHVFLAVVKGMEHCRKGGKLDVIGRAYRTLLQQWAVNAEQAVKLPSLQCDLLLQIIPHARVPLCS